MTGLIHHEQLIASCRLLRVQPTSDSLHLGNALGAIKQWVDLQDAFDAYFCVVDLHAITVPQDPATLRRRTLVTAGAVPRAGHRSVARDDLRAEPRTRPHRAGVGAGCFTGFGQASRMTQFKDKSQKQGADATTVGLFTYPVLMAATCCSTTPTWCRSGRTSGSTSSWPAMWRNGSMSAPGHFRRPGPMIPKMTAKIYDLQEPTPR